MEELESLADLLDLQDVDLQIDRLLDRRAGLPELDDYKAAHADVERLTKEVDAAVERLKGIELDLDKTTGELELTEQKAASEENRLYAGGMSARDADYLRREVEMLRTKVSNMEERVLELMEDKEQAEQALAALRAELADATARKQELEGIIGETWRKIDAEIGLKEARKAEIVPLIDPDLLELYEDLRRTRKGAVVGPLENGICGVCHLKLSAAEVAEVLRESPPRCIHCRGILVP